MTSAASDSPARSSLFVSYAGPDRAWAQWAASVLEAAGYPVELDVWDWQVGDNFVLRMEDALAKADLVLALWSASYFATDRFTTPEWVSAFVDATREASARRLLPVRVELVTPPKVLTGVIYTDVFGVDEATARRLLVEAVAGSSGRSESHPFPGAGPVAQSVGVHEGPRRPGTLPAVWNVPGRLVGFTGRTGLLADLRARLAEGCSTLVAAVNGLGGVGKTSLAVEYAHLFAGEYERVWWVDAERPDLIPENLGRLAVASGWADPEAPVAALVESVAARLRTSDRWLVVFDNVTQPEDVRGWIPQGPGHVVITSRHRGFTGLAVPVEVAVFSRAESVDLIATHLPAVVPPDADALARAVGDLPLALAQAIGLLAETGMTVPEYLAELDTRARTLLSAGHGGDYPLPLAAAIETTLARLGPQDAAAVDLLRLAAVLAPDPIPLDWLRQVPAGVLPEALAATAAQPLALRRTLGRLADLGLAVVDQTTVQVHRLTQAVLRNTRTTEQVATDRDAAAGLLAAVEPVDNGTDPTSWPAWTALLPHLLALDPTTFPVDRRSMARHAVWYLLMRGDTPTALRLAEAWHLAWQQSSGPEDYEVLAISNVRALSYRSMGRNEEARELHQATLDTVRRVLGPDHPDTLRSAGNLANDLSSLGRDQEAYELDQATLDTVRRVLGPDHPDTLSSAGNLAIDLRSLGRDQEAYELDQATYDTRRRVLGPDHPDTLRSAMGLAIDLRSLGRDQEAYELDQATYDTVRRVLGPDHPDTLRSAGNLAIDLRSLGRDQEAYELDQATYDTRRRVLGPDHPDTLRSAMGLAIDLRSLGRHQEAYELDQATYDTRRRVLGPDHPDTLRSANNLANDLSSLGRDQEAYELDQATYDTRRRVLGPDHPDTLRSANNLANDLSSLGRDQEAYELDQATLDTRRRVLGPDHPDTLRSANNLANDLSRLGRHQERS